MKEKYIMKKIFISMAIILLAVTVIPFLIVINFSGYKRQSKETQKFPDTVSVYIKSEDKVCEMNVNQYLKEVVSAEMPADFHREALRAQAIAARTYLINRMRAYQKSQTPPEHKGAYMCTDPKHCKAWISEEKRKEIWGKDKAKANWKKISDAVDSTGKLIITYNGEPISAVFHSTSSGYTENAKDVWGGDVSYLVSVRSDGDLQSPKYNSEKTIPIEEFKKTAEEKIEGVNWDNGIIGDIVRSDAGGIKTVTVGGVTVKGTDFRFMYDLRSTNADISVDESNVNIKVKGYGHGVGMSQYGANYLANHGKNFEDILKTYYTGVQLSEYDDINKIK